MKQNINKTCREVAATAISLFKIALKSRRPSAKLPRPERELVVLGNGPSLRQTIDNHAGWLKEHDLFAVNFFANTPDFFTLKPQHYILADPHFLKQDVANVATLWENIRKADWHITLHLPAQWRGKLPKLPPSISVAWYNLTPIEGLDSANKFLWDKGLGMPRPRNVLIPALMQGIRNGYKKIYVAGADHTWTRTLSVDDDNHVISVQPHFYKDSDKEQKRVDTEYKGYHLHDILQSLTIAFRSYFEVRKYAEKQGCEVVNITPGSFIDAFSRQQL